MGFSIHQISICLKGILWTDLFYSVTPGNLICRYIFHMIFSVTFYFVVLFISFTFIDGPLQTKKATDFRRAYLIALVLFVSPIDLRDSVGR